MVHRQIFIIKDLKEVRKKFQGLTVIVKYPVATFKSTDNHELHATPESKTPACS
jgi:FixJ family two-component response regulator